METLPLGLGGGWTLLVGTALGGTGVELDLALLGLLLLGFGASSLALPEALATGRGASPSTCGCREGELLDGIAAEPWGGEADVVGIAMAPAGPGGRVLP